QRRNVLLPQPLGPINDVTRQCGMSRVMVCSAWNVPYHALKSRTLTAVGTDGGSERSVSRLEVDGWMVISGCGRESSRPPMSPLLRTVLARIGEVRIGIIAAVSENGSE